MVYGYYSFAGQILDQERATFWVLPAAFGAATCGDPALFPDNFVYLQARFPWLKIEQTHTVIRFALLATSCAPTATTTSGDAPSGVVLSAVGPLPSSPCRRALT